MSANKETQLNLRLTAQDEARGVLREFSNEVRSTFESIRTLMNESFSAAPLREGFGALGREIMTSLEPVTGELRSVTNALNQVAERMKSVSGAGRKMGDDLDEAGKKGETAGEKIARAFEAHNLLTAGQILSDVGHKMLGFFADSVHAAADFDTNIHTVVASLDAMGDHSMKPEQAFQRLKQKALDLGMSGFFSANEIAEAMNTMAQQGIDASHILGGAIDTVANVAAANQQKLESTAGVISDILHQYGDELQQEFGQNLQNQLEHVGDALTKALHNGRMSMEDFLSTMRYAGPQAAELHIKFQDLAASIAELARHGIKGTQAGTTLRRMFTNLIPTTAQQKEMFDRLGFTVHGANNVFLDHYGRLKPLPEIQRILHDRLSQLSPAMQEFALKTIFGQNALSGMMALVNESPDKFKALADSMGKTGVTAEALKEKKKSLGYQIQQLHAHFDTLKKEIGDALAPVITKLLDVVNKLFEAWQKLPDGVKQAIVIFGAVVATLATLGGGFLLFMGTLKLFKGAMDPILEGVGELSKGLGKIKFSGLEKAAKGAVSGLRSLGGAIGNLITGPWRLLGNALRSLPGLVRNIPAMLRSIPGAISAVFSRMGTGIINAFRFIRSFAGMSINGVVGAIRTLITNITRIGPAIVNIIRFFTNWRNVLMLLRNGFMLVRGALTLVSGPWGALVLLIVAGVSYIISHWNQIVKWVQEHFGKTIPTNFKQFQQLCSQVWKQVEKIFSEVWNAIKKAVMDAWNYVGPTIMSGVKEVQKFWNEVWPQIQELFTEVWTVMKVFLGPTVAALYIIISGALGVISGAWKDAWNLIKDTLKFIWDAIVAIIKTCWDIISGIFKVALDLLTGHWDKAWNDMKQMLSNVWNDIVNSIGKLIDDAASWGENLLKMLADGIMSGIHWVENAVSTVASKIKSFLGFHSPTEDGPLSDSDRYMPNMMRMFADGINDNQPLVENAVNNVAEAIKERITKAHRHVEALRASKIFEMITHKHLHPLMSHAMAANPYELVAGHTSHHVMGANPYEFVAGHTSHMTPGIFNSNVQHTKNITVNITVDGRSAKTDEHLVERIAAKFREQISMHV